MKLETVWFVLTIICNPNAPTAKCVQYVSPEAQAWKSFKDCVEDRKATERDNAGAPNLKFKCTSERRLVR